MKRLYDVIPAEHFENLSQMTFLAGPRQVGKTTIAKAAKRLTHRFYYLNWDNQNDRKLILEGPEAIAEKYDLEQSSTKSPLIVFDEVHKYAHWKTFLKGFFDTYRDHVKIIVTGSTRLDVYKHGGDSMMGRYFLYRIHPLSVAELLRTGFDEDKLISGPKNIKDEDFNVLLEFGGFPDPFINRKARFSNRWKLRWKQQLLKEDVRDTSRIMDISRLELLTLKLADISGQLVNYSSLAKDTLATIPTVQNWIKTLEGLFYCFRIKPWSKNVSKSLRKQPKIYLWDWSNVADLGARNENFIAGHLFKAVHFWTDMGLGEFELFFVRDTDQREVDFLVTKNGKPWFLVEVKTSSKAKMSQSLKHFHEELETEHAFQVSVDGEFVNKDCFSYNRPVIVSAKTFLSQLV